MKKENERKQSNYSKLEANAELFNRLKYLRNKMSKIEVILHPKEYLKAIGNLKKSM